MLLEGIALGWTCRPQFVLRLIQRLRQSKPRGVLIASEEAGSDRPIATSAQGFTQHTGAFTVDKPFAKFT